MRSKIVATLTVLGAILLGAFSVAPASAEAVPEEPAPAVNGLAPDDGKYDEGEYAKSVKGEADALRTLYESYGDAAGGRITSEELTHAVAEFERTTGQSADEAAPIPTLARVNTGLTTNKSEIAAARVARELLMTHYSQAYNNYCGPAVGKMILNWEGKSTSAYNSSHNNTQARLATATYMRTDDHGSTNWGSADLPRGVNRFYGGTYLVQLKNPSASAYVGAIISNIDNRDAAAVGTTELAGGRHYNSHPSNQTIRHWLVIKGCTTDAIGARYLDPATSVWSAPNASFSHTSSTFVTRYVQPEYGIAS